MSYNILPTKQFSVDFDKLKDKNTQETIKKKIENVSEDPTRYKRIALRVKRQFQNQNRSVSNHLFDCRV